VKKQTVAQKKEAAEFVEQEQIVCCGTCGNYSWPLWGGSGYCPKNEFKIIKKQLSAKCRHWKK